MTGRGNDVMPRRGSEVRKERIEEEGSERERNGMEEGQKEEGEGRKNGEMKEQRKGRLV